MDFTSSVWCLWMAAAVASGLLEVKLNNFVMIWFAAGALVSSGLARTGLPAEVQLGAFILVSGTLFGLSRTVFRRFLMRGGHPLRTGIDAMLGHEALVVEALTSEDGTVRINGELWSARSLEGPVPSGVRVRVEQREGLKLFVRRPLAPVFAATELKRKD